MSKVKIIGGLVLAGIIAGLSGVVGHRLGVPNSLSLGITQFLVLLLTYPAVGWWYGERRNITFKRWTLASLVATIISTAIIAVIGRL